MRLLTVNYDRHVQNLCTRTVVQETIHYRTSIILVSGTVVDLGCYLACGTVVVFMLQLSRFNLEQSSFRISGTAHDRCVLCVRQTFQGGVYARTADYTFRDW